MPATKSPSEKRGAPLPRNGHHRPPTTRIVEDVFTDELELLRPRFEADYSIFLQRLWEANPHIHELLKAAPDLETAREHLYEYLDRAERSVFALDNDLHILEKATVREAVRAFRSIIGPINEKRTEFSALDALWKLAQDRPDDLSSEIAPGFLMEFIHLFHGVLGETNIYRESGGVKRGVPEFLRLEGREAATKRMESLDELGSNVRKHFMKYPSGLEPEVIRFRRENRKRILRYFDANEEDWDDYIWHLTHVIRTPEPLADLIELTAEQREAVRIAVKEKVPFGITPYYLSLMDSKLSVGYDHSIRAQVIPPKDYVEMMAEHRRDRDTMFDFMGEHDTSPVDLVTRRYPLICILKPFNTCAQICVYCQRNWEIDGVLDPKALASRKTLQDAFNWLGEHPSIGDVLVTGGDPLVMKDSQFRPILEALASLDHIYRIRVGSRTPVVLPQRFTEGLLALLEEFHQPPKREIAFVTHFEHSYEITPEAMDAVQKVKRLGIGVYNQEVYTVENSRRFESVKLRKDLRSIGVDPYYTFNMKGKEETRSYMVPVARLMQERKEEARLLPGLDRTDEPVFNVPRLGKNHLRSMQDHRVVMILPTGSRVYEFHPWEKNIEPVPPYNYVDVPIYDYLEELARRGENINNYRTIWYYY